jgi:hypothetical protein
VGDRLETSTARSVQCHAVHGTDLRIHMFLFDILS